ncbi:hypothetical protein NMG60_11031386 [Bertholletia excelsa]
MSMPRLAVPYIPLGFYRSGNLFFNHNYRLTASKYKDPSLFLANGGMRDLRTAQGGRREREKTVKNWILGAMITVLVPFLRHKWRALFKVTKEFEAMAERTEHATEVIERVAGEVEKMAEEVADELPEGGKFRRAIEVVENTARETVKDARLVEEIIDKVEEADKDSASLAEPVNDKAEETPKEADDQK